MASKVFCDCGCGHQIGEYDAGGVPLIFVAKIGIVIKMEVVAGGDFARPNLRPACAVKLLQGAELAWPRLPAAVDQSVAKALGQAVEERREGGSGGR